jgi:hypothetical protein
MTASSKARARLKDLDVNVKIKLAGLWVALMFFYLHRDVLGFMEPGHVEDLLAGELAGVRMTQAVLLGSKDSGAASGISVIFIVPMMMFGALLAVFNETTRTIAKFTPNYYVSDSLSVIFHQGSISDPAIWQNLLILAIISLVAVVAGIQLFKKIGYR